MNATNIQMLDITAPDHGVEIEWDETRRVLYVHVDGITALRICRIPALKIKRTTPKGMRTTHRFTASA